MRLEHYPPDKLKKEIRDIMGKYLDLNKYKIFFFGSRVSGGGGERSDIDIGIEGPGEVPLEIIGRMKSDAANLPTLYKIDIIDFTSADASFRDVAKQHIEIIE